jgi:hypothetical protein
MEERSISRDEVAAVLLAPEYAARAKDGRWKAWAQVSGRSIMVVYEMGASEDAVLIVTAYPCRRRPTW